MGGMDHGGIAEVHYYFKSEQPSPCALCRRLAQDKEVCSERCRVLFKWQVTTGALPKPSKMSVIKLLMSDGKKLCRECMGPLTYSDGVIYCTACLAVHMRFTEKDSVKEVGYLLTKGWTVNQIADVMDVCRGHVVQLAKANGVEFQHWADDEEKAVIVDYMLAKGVKAAAVRFELNVGTINKYARQIGLGTKIRYERLKVVAEVMFEEGAKVIDVAKELGIGYKTARVWKSKIGH